MPSGESALPSWGEHYHQVAFDQRAEVVVWKVSRLRGRREERVPYYKARLRVHRCVIEGWSWRPKCWALALSLPDTQIVLALDPDYHRVARLAAELGQHVGLEWRRSAEELSRYLF